ncbi:MAG: hypothetical protein AB1428_03825 [Bacteroidota bacterium]
MKSLCRLVASLLLFPSVVLAQPPGPPGQRPFERIEQLRKVRLIEMLELNEDQSVRFFARLNEHENRRRALMKEKGDALDRIERLIRNNADAEEFNKEFAEVAAIDDSVAAEQRRFLAGLSDILSVEQRGKMLLFERRFEKELREAMREAQRRRRMGGPE